MKLRTNPYSSLLTASLVITLGQGAMATDILWSGATTGTLDWNTGSNWTGGAFVNSGTDRADLRKDWTLTPAVNLSAPTTANGILFDDTGATGDSTLAIGNGGTPANTLTLGGTTPSISVNASTLTVSAGLAGTGGFSKSGGGVLILSGDNSALSGNVVVSGGTLQTGSAAALTNNIVRVDSGAALRVNISASIVGLNDNAGVGGSVINTSSGGKVLTVAGSGTYSFAGNFNSTATNRVGLVLSGSGSQTLSGNNTTNTNTGYQSVTGGGTLVFAKQNSIFQGLAAGAVVNSNTVSVAGIAVVSGTVALGVGDSASGYFDSSAIGTFLDVSHMGASTNSTGFRNNSIFGLDTTNATSGTFTYSTALANIGTSTGIGFAKLGAGTLILDAANTYTGVTQVRAGTLQIGVGSTTGVLASTADITVSSGATLAFNRSDATLTQSNKITGAGAVSQIGAGTTTLTSTTSDYSGGTSISAGQLNASSLGGGAVTLSGTAVRLALTRSATYSNAITISGGTGLGSQGLIDTGTGINATLGGPITISASPTDVGSGHFGSSGTGSITITGAITSSVPVSVRRNTVIFSGGGSYADFQVRAGTAKVGANNGLATNANVALGAFGSSTLDLNGFNQSLVGLSKGANVAIITNTGTSDSLLTTTGISSFAGDIQDGATNKLALTVNGGQLTVSGANNTYTGATNVTTGTLFINGIQSAATGAVGIAANATLGGSGTVGGATTFSGASIHAPGSATATAGTQSFSSTVTYGTGTIFEWDLNTLAGTYDQVTATGAITGGSAIFKVVLAGGTSFTDVFWDTDKSWTNIFTGGSGSATNLASLFSGFNASGGVGATGTVTGRGQFTFNGSSTTLNWTAVPEPTSALAGLLLTAGLLRRRRRG